MCKSVLEHYVNKSWLNQINILEFALKILIAKTVVSIHANFKNVIVTYATAKN
ncbi:unnamed protein product, partial [Eruca vesicaria subsp. sativa]|nr:unnamed protein product [Eruca vesicaria subsp. sativa]